MTSSRYRTHPTAVAHARFEAVEARPEVRRLAGGPSYDSISKGILGQSRAQRTLESSEVACSMSG
jgi:hypothetical protein